MAAQRDDVPLAACMAVALCAGAGAALLPGLGADAAGLVLFILFALAGVWLPGRALAALTGADKAGLPACGAFVYGTALLALAAALGGAAGLHGLVWVLPALGAAGWLWLRRRARRADAPGQPAGAGPALRTGPRWPWVLAWAAGLLLYAVGAAPRLAHPAAAGALIPDQDFLWNLGNARAFLAGFAPADLRVSGYTLTYHWLTELLAAGFAMAGVPVYDALAFGLPPAALGAALACIRELGGLWFAASPAKTARRQQALFAALVLCAGSGGLWKVFSGRDPFWNMTQRHVLTNINGWTTALFLLCCTLACAAVLLAGRAAQAGPALGVGVCAFTLLALAKGPVAGVAALALLAGAAAAWVFAAAGPGQAPAAANPAGPVPVGAARGALAAGRRRRGAFAAAVYGGLCCGVFLLVYRVLFAAGAGASVVFSPTGTLEKSWFANLLALARAVLPGWAFPAAVVLFWLALAVCWAPAAAPLALAGFVRGLARPGRLPARQWVAAALAGGGFLAFCIFDHEAMSQMYFAFAAAVGMALLAAEYAPALAAWARQAAGGPVRRVCRRVCALALAALAAAGFATGLCNAAALAGQGLSARGASPQAALADGWDLALTAADEAAAAALAEILPAGCGRTFATNRIHTGRALEGLSNVYSGLSGCQGWFEGFKYAVSNLGMEPDDVSARLEALRAALLADTPEELAAALPEEVTVLVYSTAAAEKGWDVLEGRAPGAGLAGLEVLYKNADVILYKVR